MCRGSLHILDIYDLQNQLILQSFLGFPFYKYYDKSHTVFVFRKTLKKQLPGDLQNSCVDEVCLCRIGAIMDNKKYVQETDHQLNHAALNANTKKYTRQ